VSVAQQTVKKFLNDPEDIVTESLAGLGAAHPDLVRIDFENQLVLRKDAPVQGKVALVSGGGSGHEPLHGGFVGIGMLDAACPGAVFTSPVPDQMLAATKAVDGGAGVIHVVKNYTGDVMNFKLAAEEAADEGIEVESVLTNDDVAVEDSLYTAGRRGTGATVLLEKIAGAKAEAGGSLAEVAAVARKVNDQARSFGVALTSCATPAAGTPTFDLGPDEMEFGVGIHGEPGRRREKIRSAAEIVAEMSEVILGDLDPASGSNVLAFVNGLGGTPLIELYVIYNELAKHLEERGLTATRSLVGDYITSLEMAGVSITILVLDDELTELWDAPVHTPALRWKA
jgi:phosphoenolpyruvate---glycerone phosphotransferase subunit DhaK